jgi:hypothetical protein
MKKGTRKKRNVKAKEIRGKDGRNIKVRRGKYTRKW